MDRDPAIEIFKVPVAVLFAASKRLRFAPPFFKMGWLRCFEWGAGLCLFFFKDVHLHVAIEFMVNVGKDLYIINYI